MFHVHGRLVRAWLLTSLSLLAVSCHHGGSPGSEIGADDGGAASALGHGGASHARAAAGRDGGAVDAGVVDAAVEEAGVADAALDDASVEDASTDAAVAATSETMPRTLAAAAAPTGGVTTLAVTTGTAISTCAQLQAIDSNLAGTYYLAGDIACAGYDVGDGRGFRPIGQKSNKQFTGKLYGNQHVIRGLFLNRDLTTNVGLFQRTSGATIQEVRIEGAYVRGNTTVGILVGAATNTTVLQVTVNGAVIANNTVGAFFGSTTGGSLGYGIADQVTLNTSGWPLGAIAGAAGSTWWNDTFAIVTPLNGWTAGLYGNTLTSAPTTVRVAYDCTKAGTCGAANSQTTAQLTGFTSFLSFVSSNANAMYMWGSRGWNQYACLFWEPGCAGWKQCCYACGRWPSAGVPSTNEGGPALNPPTCGQSTCQRNAQWVCGGVSPVFSTYYYTQTCTPGTPTWEICNGVDDDCDFSVDEGYLPRQITCGTGICANTITTSCTNGHENTTCVPLNPAPVQSECQPVGAIGNACTEYGTKYCVDGQPVDTCVPKSISSSDIDCDGDDDDCNGTADDGYVETVTSCQPDGAMPNICVSHGLRRCIEGHETNTCVAGTRAEVDDSCNDTDDDCDGRRDEDYVAPVTRCQPPGAAPDACVRYGELWCDHDG